MTCRTPSHSSGTLCLGNMDSHKTLHQGEMFPSLSGLWGVWQVPPIRKGPLKSSCSLQSVLVLMWWLMVECCGSCFPPTPERLIWDYCLYRCCLCCRGLLLEPMVSLFSPRNGLCPEQKSCLSSALTGCSQPWGPGTRHQQERVGGKPSLPPRNRPGD